ncbi:MAG: hypothetical protein ACFFBD_21180 [Candidatus Hodarchaeota archaeon]
MQIAKSLCEEHTAVLDEEILCKNNLHFCIWCSIPIGSCNCFDGFNGSPKEISLLKSYFLDLEQVFQRALNPIEKREIIQHFLIVRES